MVSSVDAVPFLVVVPVDPDMPAVTAGLGIFPIDDVATAAPAGAGKVIRGVVANFQWSLGDVVGVRVVEVVTGKGFLGGCYVSFILTFLSPYRYDL